MGFFNAEQLRYELRVRRAGRWEIREIVDDPLAEMGSGGRASATSSDLQKAEASIIARTRQLLGAAGIDAVRVVRARARSNGFVTETVIFSDEQTGRNAGPGGLPVILGTPEGEPPPGCPDLDTLCRRPGYRLAGQILRSFLERGGITAFELFHHAPHQRTLEENRTLVPGAIERAAKVLAGADARALPGHKERLTALVAQLRTATAKAAERPLPPLKDGDFAAMAAAAAALGEAGDARFRTAAAFSRSLAAQPGMAHRVAVVAACLTRPLEPAGLDMLDTFLAGVFDDASATLKLLGGQRDRASTIRAAAELASGTVPAGELQPAATILATFAGRQLLPHTVASLWDRIRREIMRGEPLSQFEPAKERESLAALRQQVLPLAPETLRPVLETGLRRRAEELRQAALDRAFG